MAGSSKNSYWTYIDNNALSADYPASTAYSWTNRDNLAHLIDSYGQVRVSWMGKSGRVDSYTLATTATGQEVLWTTSFPLTVWHPNGQTGSGTTGLFTRVIYKSTDAANTLSLSGKYTWDSEPVNSNAAFDIYTFSDSTTSTTGKEFEDIATTGVITSQSTNKGRRTFPLEEGGDDHTVDVFMARLELLFSDNNNDGGALLGVQVIEFPVWP